MAKKNLTDAPKETPNTETTQASSECSPSKNCCDMQGECNRRFWIGAAFRIAFVVACIVGAFFLGMYVQHGMGYDHKDGYHMMRDG